MFNSFNTGRWESSLFRGRERAWKRLC